MSTCIAIPQRRVATFLRLFKPGWGVITAYGGLAWACSSDGSAICIGESDDNFARKISFHTFGKMVRSAGAKADLLFDLAPTRCMVTCDTFGEQEIDDDGVGITCDPLDKRGEFLTEIPADVVKQMAKYVDRCDSEPSRFALGGMLIEQEHWVATDGRRLVVGDIDHLGAHEFLRNPDSDDGEHIDFTKNIPAGLIKYAASFGESIDVFENLLAAGDTVATPLEGRYPTWRKVLIQPDTEIEVDVDDMIARCDKQLAVNKLKDGEARGLDFTMTVDDHDVVAMIEASYLKVALKGLSSATIKFNHEKGTSVDEETNVVSLISPIEITSDDTPGVKEIIMPMARDRG